MAGQKLKTNILLDWFTVSYRSVVLGMLVVIALAAAGGVYWYYFSELGPRQRATRAMDDAEARLAEAVDFSGSPQIEELKASARTALGEARSAFAERDYDRAIMAANYSADLSQRLIDMSRGTGKNKGQARFYRIEGDVRVKRAGEFAWEPARASMVLRLADQVRTSSSSSAQIIYFDGTITTIRPGSLLEIRQLYQDPGTRVQRVTEKLNWGEITATTQKRNVEGSFHEVATEKMAARSEDETTMRVAYDRKKGTSAVDVFRGRIEVASGERRASLKEGERVRANARGDLSPKEILPGVPRLTSPPDERVFVYDDPSKEQISLSWEKVPGASRYHLVISDHALFTDALYDGVVSQTSVEIDNVKAGSYFWKVVAISASGVAGPSSAPRHFRITSQRIRDTRDTTPPELEITESVQTGAMLIINGRTEPGAQLWIDNERVDVYDDGSFSAILRLRQEGLNVVTLEAQDAAGNQTRIQKKAYVESY